MANKRRGNGEGSFRQRGSSWEASIMLGYKSDGTRNVKTFTAPTKAEARKKMQAYIDARDRGMDVDTNYTLAEWIEVYMQLHSPNIKPVTIENYRYTSKLINKHLGDKPIKKIRPMDVEMLLLRLKEEGRSDSALSQVRGFLYSVMHKAVGNNLIVNNPVAYAPKLRKRPPTEKEIFTQEEYKLLMEKLPNTLIGNSIKLLVFTGMRSQELLGLTPENIAPDGSEIYIRQAVSMERGHVTISTPKSYDSVRAIAVPSIVRESALFLRNTQDRFVWQSPVDDKPINPSTFRKLYRECLESIPGVRYLPPHNCRHSYVSMLVANHVDLPVVQALVGHSTQLVTMGYTHIPSTIKKNAVEELSALFNKR